MALRDPLLGRVLDGRYRVQRRIGKGGMGNVYLAEHVLIGRKVAIKTLHESLCNPELIERFHREARVAAAIGNDHLKPLMIDDSTVEVIPGVIHGFLDIARPSH